MKKLSLVLILLMILASCSSTADKENDLVFECYDTQDSGQGEYYEEYMRLVVDGKETDVIKRQEIFGNWHFNYELDPEIAKEQDDARKDLFGAFSGVTHKTRYDKYLFQEEIIYDYEQVDFNHMVDVGHLEKTEDGQVPDYISIELALEDYQGWGYQCQQVQEGTVSLMDKMIYKDFNVDGSAISDQLPELKSIDSSDTVTKRCVYVSQDYPDLDSYADLLVNENQDIVFKHVAHDEFAIEEDTDRSELEKSAIERGLVYNSIEGITYAFEILEDTFIQDITYNYEVIDLAQMVEAGIIGSVDGVIPSFISYSKTIENHLAQGYQCEN